MSSELSKIQIKIVTLDLGEVDTMSCKTLPKGVVMKMCRKKKQKIEGWMTETYCHGKLLSSCG